MIAPAESIRGMVAGQMSRMRNGYLWPDGAETIVCMSEGRRYLREALVILTRYPFKLEEVRAEFGAVEAVVAQLREHFKQQDEREQTG